MPSVFCVFKPIGSLTGYGKVISKPHIKHWFGMWHYVPVSINNDELTGLIGMMVGPMMMGLYLSYLTKKMNTLWWAIVIHTIGSIIMIA
jgi:hypothetical protein